MMSKLPLKLVNKQGNKIFNLVNVLGNIRFLGNIADVDVLKNSQFYKNMAPNYHKILDTNTLFLHRKWRDSIIENIQIEKNSKILDVAGGTGLNAFKLLKKLKNPKMESNFIVTVSDINLDMLKMGKQYYDKLGYNQNLVKFIESDVHNLPFNDGSFDTVIFSLAVKSTVNFNAAFREIYRVLKPRGKFIVMDFYFTENHTLIQRLYLNYLKYVATTIEKIFIGDFKVAEYVASEILEVVSKTNVERLMMENNFKNLEVKPMSLGIAALTIGYKP